MHLGAGRVPQAVLAKQTKTNHIYPGQHLEKFLMDQIVLWNFFTFSCFFLGPLGTGAERGAASTMVPLSRRI